MNDSMEYIKMNNDKVNMSGQTMEQLSWMFFLLVTQGIEKGDGLETLTVNVKFKTCIIEWWQQQLVFTHPPSFPVPCLELHDGRQEREGGADVVVEEGAGGEAVGELPHLVVVVPTVKDPAIHKGVLPQLLVLHDGREERDVHSGVGEISSKCLHLWR